MTTWTRYALGLLACVALWSPRAAAAQTPIVVGAATNLVWDQTSPVAGFTPAMAQALTYVVTITAPTPVVVLPALTGVTCVAQTPVAPDLSSNRCKVPASILPLGTATVTMTAAGAGTVTLPSAPLSYVTIVVPVPKGLALQ